MGNSLVPRRRWRKVIAAVGALALLIAACGGGDSDSDGGGDGNTGGSPDAQAGGSVVYALEAETLNFCTPSAQLAIAGIIIAQSVYDTLVIQNGDGEIVPFLAESVEPNEDATVWTIKLREGITFHNGEPLDAEALKLNLDAFAGIVPVTPTALLFPILLTAAVDGQPTGVESTEIVDPLTVQVNMIEPWGDFPAFLWGSGRIGIAAPEQIRSPDCATHMIGTGPFVHANPGEVREPRVTKNPDYWRQDSEGRQLPYLDEIQFRVQRVGEQMVNGLRGGEFDIGHVDNGREVAAIEDLAASGQLKANREEPGFREVGHLLLNNGKPPFDNINARKAVFLAGNRTLINDLINEGEFTLASGIYDERVGGYLPPEDSGLPDASDRDAALEEARSLAQQYEQETGNPLRFEALTTTDPTNTETLEILRDQLAEADIEMTISAPVIQSQIIDLAVGGALGTALEDAPQAFLWRNHPGTTCSSQYVWFYSGYPTNFGIINDPELDEAFADARRTLDEDERDEACERANRRLNEQVHHSWFTFTDWMIGTQPNVNGIYGPDLPDGSAPPQNIAGIHRLEGIWLS